MSWPLGILLSCVLAYLIAAIAIEHATRRLDRRFRTVAAEMMAEARSAPDRAIVLHYMQAARVGPPMSVLMVLMPLLAAFAAVMIAAHAWGLRRGLGVPSLEAVEAASVMARFDEDPRQSPLWTDPRRLQIAFMSDVLAATDRPFGVIAAAAYGWPLAPVVGLLALVTRAAGQSWEAIGLQHLACFRAVAVAMRNEARRNAPRVP